MSLQQRELYIEAIKELLNDETDLELIHLIYLILWKERANKGE